MKGFSLKHIALKVDVIGLENIPFKGALVHLSAQKFTGWGSDGLGGKGVTLMEEFFTLSTVCITLLHVFGDGGGTGNAHSC